MSSAASAVLTGSTPSAPDLLAANVLVLLNSPLTLISSTVVESVTASLTIPVALLNF